MRQEDKGTKGLRERGKRRRAWLLFFSWSLSLLVGVPAARAAASVTWQPPITTQWQWQLSTPVDQTVDVPVYDIDGFDNNASVVTSLHAKQRSVICYLDVGTWEDFRSDAGSFPGCSDAAPGGVCGNTNGWPGERWLDIRQIAILQPLMQVRLQMCKSKGFDAVEPDNVDAWDGNNAGFPISAADQLRYNILISTMAHALGMGVALKNDINQVSQLLPYFDFELDEQCFQYGECGSLQPFITNGKAVLEVEYSGSTSNFCPQAIADQFSSILKDLNLTATRTPCNPPAPGAPGVSSSGGAAGSTGLPFSYQIVATNNPTSYSAGNLPSGLSVNSATGLISGTPSVAAGTYKATMGAASGSGAGPVVPLIITLAAGSGYSACDVNHDNLANVVDVQLEVNMAMGVSPCTGDINKDGSCNVVDVQRVVNAALGGACVSP